MIKFTSAKIIILFLFKISVDADDKQIWSFTNNNLNDEH